MRPDSLRQNLCVSLDESNIVYCNVTGEQQNLWLVSNGDFDSQTQIESTRECTWNNDVIVALSVSCNGRYIFARGTKSGYVLKVTKGTPVIISEPQELYNHINISESHWHPSCEDVLFVLSECRTVGTWNASTHQLHGLITLGGEQGEATIAISPVANSDRQLSSLALCSASSSGVLALDFPIVPPCAAVQTDIIQEADPHIAELIMSQLDSDKVAGDLVDSLPIDESRDALIPVPATSIIAVVEDGDVNPVLGLCAQHIPALENGFTVIAVTMTSVYCYFVPCTAFSLAENLSGVGELLCHVNLVSLCKNVSNLPWELNQIVDQCRVFFDNGIPSKSNSLIIHHPVGILVLDKKSTSGTITISHVHDNAPAVGENACIVMGLAQFTEKDRKEQQYVLMRSDGELLLDYIDDRNDDDSASTHIPKTDTTNDTTTIKLNKIEQWSHSDNSCLHPDARTSIITSVKRVAQTKTGESSVQGILPLLQLRSDATNNLNSALGTLQDNLRQKMTELRQLKEELQAMDRQQKALISSKETEFTSRMNAMLSKAESGGYCNPQTLSSAITRVLVSDVSLLPRVRIISDPNRLEQLVIEAGLPCPPELIASSGQDGLLLKMPIPDVFNVAIADNIFALPATVLSLEGKCQTDQWERSAELADEREEQQHRRTEEALWKTTSSLRKMYTELVNRAEAMPT